MGRKLPKYLLAANQIKNVIKRQDVDKKLPGERVLAKELSVSYMTIRKAIDSLVEQGYLYRVPTKGTFVADRKFTSRNKTRNIGYFLDSSIKDGLTSPYYSLIFNALEKETGRMGYALLYFSNLSEENVNHSLKKVDGVIASCFPRIEHVIQEIKQLVPLVVIDNASFDKSIPSVIIDNFNAVVDSVNYLYSVGHKRIGFITGLEDSDVGTSRLAGYRFALKSHDIKECPELIIHGDYSFSTGAKGMAALLSTDDVPTAVMCANDIMAMGAIKEASRQGLSIPEDISIIGFDDISVAAQITPPLTTISAPIDKIAKQSSQMIDALINGKDRENQHIALPAQLVIRGSAAKPQPT